MKKYLLVSFFATDEIAINRLEQQWSSRDESHKHYLGRDMESTKKVTSKDLGGEVCVIDITNIKKGFLNNISIPVATGMYYDQDVLSLYVGSGKKVVRLKKGEMDDLNNNLFNDVHTIHRSLKGNLLIASTGVDGVLEIDPTKPNELVWSWLATENGYNKSPNGEIRTIDRNTNYQLVGTNTTQHTTHINSAIQLDSGNLLATLFHQGELVEINYTKKTTRTLIKGMKSPHSVRNCSVGFSVCDTRGNKVILTDLLYNEKFNLKGNFNWVQDCIETEDGTFVVADSNNNRLVFLDKNSKISDIFKFPTQRKVSNLLLLTESQLSNIF